VSGSRRARCSYARKARYASSARAAAAASVAVALHVYGSFVGLDTLAAVLATATLAAAAARALDAYRAFRAYEQRARRDPLTGLLNHGSFHESLHRLVGAGDEQPTPFSIVLLDLTRFKQVNDARGHAEGDRVLREVARCIAETCRQGDGAYRVGGGRVGKDERELVAAAASVALRRVERALGALEPPMRAAAGVASWPQDGPTVELMLLQADRSLYAAKGSDESRQLRVAAALAASGAGGRAGETVTDDSIERFLAVVRNELGMEIGYYSEFTGGQQVFRGVSDEDNTFGFSVGDALPLEGTYCQRMVDGEIENVVADTAHDPRVAHLEVTRAAALGAYIGVPIRRPDGSLYGTLCCASHRPKRTLSSSDVTFLHVLAGLLAGQIEREERAATERRLAVEETALETLIAAVEARDNYTGEHSKVVVALADQVGRALGLPASELTAVTQVALLHDIGKLGIPDAILHKPGGLTDDEWRVMHEHPAIGARIVSSIPGLAQLAPAVRAEHERWDGGGYPDGLTGRNIPLASRIAFACDAFHAMTSTRPYRDALPLEVALRELRANAGTQFDPAVVDALLRVATEESVVAINRLGPLPLQG
jgi:diguanylate cyclase (GGDEF)-like protein